MPTRRTAIVFVHGLFSSPKTWAPFQKLIRDDTELAGFDTYFFQYWSPSFKINPLRRIPDFNTIADSLQTYIRDELPDYKSIVLVAHSQGGLIVQRFLARTLSRGHGRYLERVHCIVMFACPNDGSQLLSTLRKAAWPWHQPQERELRPISEAIIEARQIVLDRVVYATSCSEIYCKIPIFAYAGEADNIVTPASAKSVFPDTGVLPGDHFGIIQPKSLTDRSYVTLKRHLCSLQPEVRTNVPPDQDVSGGWEGRVLVDHHSLFGIQRPMQDLNARLHNHNGDWIISIFGVGGAGKTTLAYKLIKEYAAAAAFTRIAWVSAKSSYLGVGGNVEQLERTGYYWEELLADVAQQLQLGVDQIPGRIEEQFANAVHHLPSTERCLIVIDNLETVYDARHAVEYIDRQHIVAPHKVLLTTRDSAHPYSTLVSQLQWNRLPDTAAREFAAYLSRDDPELTFTDEELASVVESSGGNPLIIKLIIHLSIDRKQPVREVISNVHDSSHAIGHGLAVFLFEEAMATLQQRVGNQTAENLLRVFGGRSAGEWFPVDRFYELSCIESREDFNKAKTAASRLALIMSSRGNTLFSVHPVLREFIKNRFISQD